MSQLGFRSAWLVWLALVAASPARAQGSPAVPPDPAHLTISGSLRTRFELSNWFGDDQNGEYGFAGSLARLSLGRSRPRTEWQLEIAVPVLLALPQHANVAGPPGALGSGAVYFAANDGRTNLARVFAKQVFLRLKRFAGVEGQSLKIGRLEFIDGTETAPNEATLSVLKRERIAHRLIGTFAFTHVGRSVDGVQYGLDRPAFNVTAIAARPTEGVFQADGWRELDVALFYAAVTSRTAGEQTGEWRLFGLAYGDHRAEAVKTDNRSLEIRRSDRSAVSVGTLGGHYLQTVKPGGGTIDLLVWGALQGGSWGTLDHRAYAISAESGWQLPLWPSLAPWVRVGFTSGSGDDDPNDDRHATFFQVLPTPRVYARFPFYNMMNTRDAFAELRLRPSARFVLRGDVHSLRLADRRDLWYQGGGAFQRATFGYSGRPSNGQTKLATLYDLSGDIAVNPRVSLAVYGSYASGSAMTESIHGTGPAAFGYAEVLLRF
jgi:hypothetical protein